MSLPYIFQVLRFTRPRYQVSVYRTIGPLVYILFIASISIFLEVYILTSTGTDPKAFFFFFFFFFFYPKALLFGPKAT